MADSAGDAVGGEDVWDVGCGCVVPEVVSDLDAVASYSESVPE